MGYARSAEELTLLRALQGAITGVISAANALVAASTPRSRAGWSLGLMQTAVWSGAAVGPLIGGLMADQFGFHATFKVTGLLLVVAWIAVRLWVVEDREAIRAEAAGQAPSMLAAWKRVLTTDGMAGLYSVKFTVRLAAAVILPVAPLFVASMMDSSGRVATVAGLFTAITAAASTLSAIRFGALGDRIGYRPVLVGGCVASGLTFLLFLGVHSIPALIALAVVSGIANGAIAPSIGALLASTSPKGGQGTVYGIDASMDSAARMVAPLIGMTVASWFTLQASFAVAGLFFLFSAALAMLLLPRPAARVRQPSGAMGMGD